MSVSGTKCLFSITRATLIRTSGQTWGHRLRTETTTFMSRKETKANSPCPPKVDLRRLISSKVPGPLEVPIQTIKTPTPGTRRPRQSSNRVPQPTRGVGVPDPGNLLRINSHPSNSPRRCSPSPPAGHLSRVGVVLSLASKGSHPSSPPGRPGATRNHGYLELTSRARVQMDNLKRIHSSIVSTLMGSVLILISSIC